MCVSQRERVGEREIMCVCEEDGCLQHTSDGHPYIQLMVDYHAFVHELSQVAGKLPEHVELLLRREAYGVECLHTDEFLFGVPLQVGMLEGIPGLINAIRMIHSISRYYNTSERMTSLFVKVSYYILFFIPLTLM